MEEFKLPLEHMAFKYWTITDLWIYFINARVIVLLFIAAVIIWFVSGFYTYRDLVLNEDFFKNNFKLGFIVFVLFWYGFGGFLLRAFYLKYL